MEDKKEKKVNEEVKSTNTGPEEWFHAWRKRSSIESGDSLKTILVKLLIRITGIILLIILSPLLLIIFVFALAFTL
tara:strand:+ start:1081 stop:1308 length:228 start_codon:yes stop_codon:yes gene_type:complete